MTNYEKIKALSCHDMALLLRNFCLISETCNGCGLLGNCAEGAEDWYWWERWLERECDE